MNNTVYCNDSNAGDTLVYTLDQLYNQGYKEVTVKVVPLRGWMLIAPMRVGVKVVNIIIE